MINKWETIPNYIQEDEGSAVVNTTDAIAPVQKKVGTIMKRKRKSPMNNETEDKKKTFTTVDCRESKLTKDEFERMRYHTGSVLVPIDEDCIEYKLLNFDEYGRVFENAVLVSHKDRKVYVEANSKETINYLLIESKRGNNYNMKLPEMKHISNLVRSLTEGFSYTIIHAGTEYSIKF